jgi:serine/threonine-protein kinase
MTNQPNSQATVYDHTCAGPIAESAGAGLRYQLLEEIGRGGMGVVFRGYDIGLERDLAVKVLQARHQQRPDLVRRFLDEAKVNGKLQHPGIAPVHEAGRLPDGRPYFAMKLVDGLTLAELLQGRPNPADKLPLLLKVFEQVCQTLAYAHSRGIIHRDLKPANIMVGPFGEVLVMDWGLARALSSGSAGSETAPPQPQPHQPADAEGPARQTTAFFATGPDAGRLTQAGMAVGTPAYMAPEQARGELENLDERCDVFGLGAILCEILTGQPPYHGQDGSDTLDRARQGALANALERLGRCGAEEGLVRLATACLAADPASRPRDAGAVADAVTAYLASMQDRLKKAEVERAADQARAAEERKRRWVMMGLAAALLGLVIVAAGAGLWLQRNEAQSRELAQRQELEERQMAESALDKVAQFQQKARWKEARAVLDEATARLGEGGPEDLARRLAQARADLDLVAKLDSARMRYFTVSEGAYDGAGAMREYEEALGAFGLACERQDVEEAASLVKQSAIHREIVAALEDWALLEEDGPRLAWLLAVARLADPGPWTDRFREPATWRDVGKLKKLVGELNADLVKDLSPTTIRALGMKLTHHGVGHVLVLRKALLFHPGDFWLNYELGEELWHRKQPLEALGFYYAALAIRPDVAVVYNGIGNAMRDCRRWDEAVMALSKAIELDDRHALFYRNLGNALCDKGEFDLGIAAHRKAVLMAPTDGTAHFNLGAALERQGALDEANRSYRSTIACCEVGRKPTAAQRHLLAQAYSNLGNNLRQLGDPDASIDACEKAISFDANHAFAHNNLGAALFAKGLKAEAVPHIQKAIALDAKYAVAHANLGGVYLSLGKLDEASACYDRAVALDRGLAGGLLTLGQAYGLDGRWDRERECIRRYLNLAPDKGPGRARALAALRECEENLALEAKLPAVLRGEIKPDGIKEKLNYAFVFLRKKYPVASARLFDDVLKMTDVPGLGAELASLRAGLQHHAARAALLASRGQGLDAAGLDEKERARWRRQALAWLQQALATHGKALKDGGPAARKAVADALRAWQKDRGLDGLRAKEELARLPAPEREACRKLWAAVGALLAKAEGRK